MNSTLRQTSIIFYLALAVLIGAFHLAYSTPIELDFDTLEKWYVADKLAKDWNFQWLAIDHHTMRWAIVVPQAIVSALVPGNYISFYIVPIIGYSIFLLVLIFLSEKSSGIPRRYLVLVTVILLLDPMSQVMASQLKPNVYGLFYSALGCFLIIQHLEKSSRWALSISPLLFFCAYGAHVTYVFFFWGAVLYLFTIPGERKNALKLTALFIVFVVLETLLFTNLFGGEHIGRLGALANNFGPGKEKSTFARAVEESGTVFWGLLRFKTLPGYQKILLLVYCLTVPFAFLPFIRRKLSHFTWILLSMSSLFLVLSTWGVVKIDPITPLLNNRPRYLSPFFPLALVFLANFWWTVSKSKASKIGTLPLGAISLSIMFAYIISTNHERCTWESQEISWELRPYRIFQKSYCGMFRYLNNQNIVPTSPTFFILKAEKFYKAFYDDYISGRVALPGGGLGPLYEIILTMNSLEYPVKPIQTPRVWYSVDGSDYDLCIDNLGAHKDLKSNYYSCDTVSNRAESTWTHIDSEKLGLEIGK